MRRHLAAVTVITPSYEDGLAFFVGVLGFSVVEDSDQGGGKRWLVVAPSPEAECRVLIARAATAEQAEGIGRQAGGRVAFFLHTDDFERDHGRLSAAGVEFDSPPRDESYGRVVVFRDPWGNRWDLVAPA